jgi:hypothetical protein
MRWLIGASPNPGEYGDRAGGTFNAAPDAVAVASAVLGATELTVTTTRSEKGPGKLSLDPTERKVMLRADV